MQQSDMSASGDWAPVPGYITAKMAQEVHNVHQKQKANLEAKKFDKCLLCGQ